MRPATTDDQQRWQEILKRVKQDFVRLPADERVWLAQQVDVIADCQRQLDLLFHEVDGGPLCSVCSGSCCGSGRHHFSLANLLAYLFASEEPPAPDFSRSCPFLGVAGCQLPAARRPYNCITFFCEILDNRFSLEQRARWTQLDKRLRVAYLAVAERYPVASLHGLWLAMARSGDGTTFRQNQDAC